MFSLGWSTSTYLCWLTCDFDPVTPDTSMRGMVKTSWIFGGYIIHDTYLVFVKVFSGQVIRSIKHMFSLWNFIKLVTRSLLSVPIPLSNYPGCLIELIWYWFTLCVASLSRLTRGSLLNYMSVTLYVSPCFSIWHMYSLKQLYSLWSMKKIVGLMMCNFYFFHFQDYTWFDIQCLKTVHGNEPEIVWWLHTTV